MLDCYRQFGAGPVRRVRLHDAQCDGADADDQQRDADPIDRASALGLFRFLQQGRAMPQRQRTQRQVQVEGPRPADRVDDERTQARPDRRRQRAHRAPQAHRHRALAVRKCVQHDRQRRRRQQRGAERLRHARRDQPGHVAGQSARRRGGEEQRDAEQEHLLAAMRVGQAAGRDQHRGVDHRVGVEHPRHVGRRGAGKAGSHGAKRREQHRRVERDEKHRDAGDPEHGPGRCVLVVGGAERRMGRGGGCGGGGHRALTA